ncbi:hypothetical protein BXZ70DRAFT_478734 [Cristinia sonorae]|uniref:F-box domain-containing protein n=1 Tax=Cristinia sonorae TaxID=1940300 RepID=A0A8K0UH81_9AGAR|nr:hypothetical protein BXZ70DRAFT_478734 [Cristinia sonorae]
MEYPQCSPSLATLIHRLLGDDSGVSDFPASEMDSAVRQCEEAILEYQRVIRMLRAQWNTRAAIHRLPDEIIEAIFWETIDEQWGLIGVVKLSGTCRRWRDVALRSSRLWSVVHVDGTVNATLVRNLVDRACSWPLSLSLSDISYPFPRREVGHDLSGCCLQTWKSFCDVLPRTRRLRWTFTLYDIADGTSRELQPTDMPFLETLDIHVLPPEVSLQMAFPSLRVFSGGLPALRTLTIRFKPQKKSYLSFEGVFELFHLLSLLRLAPQLEYLELHGVVMGSCMTTTHYPTVPLPKIKVLHVSDSLPKLVFLLDHLDVSNVEDCLIHEVTPTFYVADSGPAKRETLLQALASHLLCVYGPNNLNEERHPFTCRVTTILASPENFSLRLTSTRSSRALDLALAWDYARPIRQEQPPGPVKFLWDQMPHFADVEVLEVVGPFPNTRRPYLLSEMHLLRNLLTCASYMDSLRTLVFKNCTLETIQTSGLLQSALTSDADLHHPSFPNLTHLQFEDIFLGEDTEDSWRVSMLFGVDCQTGTWDH